MVTSPALRKSSVIGVTVPVLSACPADLMKLGHDQENNLGAGCGVAQWVKADASQCGNEFKAPGST